MSNIFKNFKAIRKNAKRFMKSSFFRAKFIYTKYYENLPINDNVVLIQSYSGTSMTGNAFYLLKELCDNSKYTYLTKVVAVNEKNYDNVCEFLKIQSFKNIRVIKLHSREYCKMLASAKYLINNVTFPFYFIKREEQVYLNTWHGTPLKALGKSMEEDMLAIGNVQRNFLMTDFLLAPNEFTFDILRNDYMLNHFYTGTYLLNGYPRNHIFNDIDYQKKVRQELELEDKKIVAYMPTWRGTHALRSDTEQYIYIMHMLIELEKNIDDSTLIFIKEHSMSSIKIDFDQFEKIRPFPEEYETYQFLSIADSLITDYSSVMFDYANTGRKVILYSYDREEYLAERGFYIEFDSLPFTIVDTTKELIHEVNHIDCYKNYNEEIFKYIRYDQTNTIEALLDLMILNEKDSKLNLIPGEQYQNGKENVLIFTGALLRNGITTALKGILHNIDSSERNYILTFSKGAVERNKGTLKELGDYDYISIQGQKNLLIREAICSFLYFRFNMSNAIIEKHLKNIYVREAKRVYGNIKFDYLIHYTGYERKFMNLFRFMDGYKMIYVHSNLVKESKTRKNVHLLSLNSAYQAYDKIVTIRESSEKELLLDDVENMSSKIALAHNLNNYHSILENAKKDIVFDDNTLSNVELNNLVDILDSDENKFINVARFSVEKGLDNLVSAFEKYYMNNHSGYLIIIGGHGNTYEDIMNQVENSSAKEHIVIIQSMSNPFPILAKSNAFVLSSHYEGLPMVIMEALILDIPVISTAITGPKEFLEQGYGYLVEDSVDGLCSGMEKYKETHLDELQKFDYIAFNKKALAEFSNLFNK